MKVLKIWVDDVRQKPSAYDLWIKSVDAAIAFLMDLSVSGETARILLDLDHDAGDYSSEGGDYIRILDWLEETDFLVQNPHICLSFSIHSWNPVGRENMMKIIIRNKWNYCEREF